MNTYKETGIKKDCFRAAVSLIGIEYKNKCITTINEDITARKIMRLAMVIEKYSRAMHYWRTKEEFLAEEEKKTKKVVKKSKKE